MGLGATQAITWTQTEMTGGVTIELWKRGNPFTTIGGASVTAGSLNWVVPGGFPIDSDYQIKIYQGAVADFSNANFNIASYAFLYINGYLTQRKRKLAIGVNPGDHRTGQG